MKQFHRLARWMKFVVTACLLIIGRTAIAQQGSQPLTNKARIITVAEGGPKGAPVQKTRSAKARFTATEPGLAGSAGVSQLASNAPTDECAVKPKIPTTEELKEKDSLDKEYPECKYASRGQECVIKVDRTDLTAVGAQEVASGTKVHIRVFHKSPFEKVRFESERKEVAPPPNPISGLISLISGAAGGITGARTTLGTFTASCLPPPPQPTAGQPPPRDPYPDQRRLEAMTATLRQLIDARLQKVQEVGDTYEKLRAELDRFFKTDFCDKDPEHISANFEVERQKYVERICSEVTSKPPVSTEGEDQLLKDISDLLKRIVLDTSSKQDCISQETAKISEASGALQLLKAAIAKLDEARKQFADIRERIIDLEGAQCIQDLLVVADRQADIVGNLVIKNLITGKDDDKKLFTKVSYRDLPRASLSAGVLLSSLEKRKFVVASVFDAPGATATDPVQSHKEILGEASRPQVIPFTFVNIRLADWKIGKRLFTFNIAPGVGINPNNGTTETEFAFGPSFGVGNVYFFGGAHFGRQPDLINGFSVGNRVPDNFTTPVGRSWKTGFGFGVSYRLPLP